ncbi:5-oxoprolinase subunit PxpA [Rhodococcus sp. IEGM 1381]|uniref:LamB/YcsF family protein n=1 Tax=Rhodococcus sp. IEGM 1381 TaxID=3047085 RepID=UPI0024B7556B|nr:5-oxoprolinase subunit PxpA [Rhodococcus sp. IEGM 1381]MDI9897140.1 5-oxoprolinase subunit PxpA [Rhodococcus sp. IEGM 1381]
MAITIDLVADLGESFGAWTMGDDEALLDLLTSANVACGFHAGDPRTMDATVRRCVERGIGIGAHPSFPDLVGFGRRTMDLTAHEVRTDVLYQIGALQAFATAHGTTVSHVAPHGRLGNLVATRHDYAEAVIDAVESVDPAIVVLAQDGLLADEARGRNIAVGIVGIADRAYRPDGTLVPRSEPGAIIADVDELVARTVRMVTEGVLDAVDGTEIPISADTVLLHGDNPGAVDTARAVRAALHDAGVLFAPLRSIVDARCSR